MGKKKWRMLEVGEMIRPDDECIPDGRETWVEVGMLFSKCTYNHVMFVPIRRAVVGDELDEVER